MSDVSTTTTGPAPVSDGLAPAPRPARGFLHEESVKLPAFLRRDLLIAWSYRVSFLSDVVGMVVQAFVFGFLSQMVDPGAIPRFGDRAPSYLAFVLVGIVVGSFVQLGMSRVMTAIRQEQLMGTLESLFMTPTTSPTLQVGLVAFDLVYVPVRTGLFLLMTAALFGVHLNLARLDVSLAVMVALAPVVWGLGAGTAAFILAFRRGAGLVGFGAMALSVSSGAYFPLDLFPGWVVRLAEFNPIAIALEAMRSALLGGAGWGESLDAIVTLLWIGAVTMGVGMGAFEWALRRERHRGTLGLY